jgi:hypothetical protein
LGDAVYLRAPQRRYIGRGLSARLTIKGEGMASKEAAASSGRAARIGTRLSRLSALLIAAGLATAALGFSATPAFATTTDTLFVVASGGSGTSNCQSAGAPCTLTQALSQATSGITFGGDNVVIDLGPGTYHDSDYAIPDSGSLNQLTLQSQSASPDGTVLAGDETNTLLTVDAPYPVSVLGVTFETGGGAGPGADLLDEGIGPVAMDDDVVNGGVTSPATGLVEATNGSLTVTNTTIENGGLDMFGVEGNGGEVEVDDSTITGELYGVALLGSNRFTVVGSTLANNEFGLVDSSPSDVAVTDSTISSNTGAGIAIVSDVPDIELGGDILANAAASMGNCFLFGGAPPDDLGYNVTDDTTCDFGSAHGSIVASTSAIGLLPLASNGGPTETQQITSASVAHDIVPTSQPTLCAADLDDQRGLARLQPGASGCDAGAYQVAPPTLTSITTPAADPPASVTLTGTNLQLVTGVTFGSSDTGAAITAQTSDSLTVAVPALAEGSQPITVTSPDGAATIGFTVAVDPTITTASLPSAEVAQPYSATLAASGGVSPLAFSITAGALPAGLTLSSSGTISGTPTSASSSTFTVEVTDAYGVAATAGLSLSVSAAPFTPPVASTPVATTPVVTSPVVTHPVVTTPVAKTPVRAPTVKIESTSIKLQGKSGNVKLACTTATCAGKMQIVKTVREKVKKGKKTVTRTKTLVLASGSYRLAVGKTKSFVIKLTTIGAKDLRASAARPLHETLLVTVTGGRTARRTVKLT